LQTSHPWLHLLRSACQLGATSFFFLSLAYIGLAEATALADINPILITLGAALVLGEKLERHRVLGVVLSMVGALIIIRPGSDVFSYSALLPVACAFCYAANAILTRYIGRSETPWSSLLHAAVFGALMTSLLLPWFWRPVQTSDIPAFLVLGLLGTGAQFCIIRSYSIAEASVVAPFAYIGILFAIVWGVVLYQDYPDVWTIIGALVIVGSGLYVWRYELVRKTTKTTGV
jgi:drug/metabolite transporter (DMT)-like permease